MRKFILYTTIFSVFSEALLINYIIDWKLFYLLIFMNFFLISVIQPIQLSKGILKLITIIFVLGFLGVILGSNSVPRIFSQLIGITIISLFYYNFFRINGYDVDFYFKLYENFAVCISIIGLLIFLFNLIVNREIIPVKSFMLEPAHFVTVMLPACYSCYKNWELKHGKIKFFIIISGIILSFSSLGLLGLMLGVFILPKRINILRILVPLTFVALLFVLLFNFVPSFNMRVGDTLKSFLNKDLENANLSSYALVSNIFVAYESFIRNPFFGGGIGSHILSHERFISSISGTETFGEMINLNAQDANSFFIRVVSEMGLFGVMLIFYFIFKFYSNHNQQSEVISRAILLYFFCKLLREGHYFSPEMYFFIMAYWYNYKSNDKLHDDNLKVI